jgi:hypothetical protein
MKNRALLSAVALCFVVAGCESKKEPPAQPKVADKVVPVPAAAPTPPPASAAQDATSSAQVAQVADAKSGTAAPAKARNNCQGGQRCLVTLTVDANAKPCKVMKDKNPLKVMAGSPEKITWKVATAGWVFDAKGIDFSGNPQFNNGSGADGDTWTVDDANTDKTPTPHNYKINLKKGAQKCSKDPSIVNGVLVED